MTEGRVRLLAMAALTAAALGGVVGEAAALQCPGGYPVMDQWGKARCRSFVGAQPRSSQPGPRGCPLGKYPTYGADGRTVCRSYSNASPGGSLSNRSRAPGMVANSPPSGGGVSRPKPCRVGTYATTNAAGRQVCKSY